MAALCEANFLRLQRLLPVIYTDYQSDTGEFESSQTGDSKTLALMENRAALCLRLCDLAPFTTTLELQILVADVSDENQRLDFSEDARACAQQLTVPSRDKELLKYSSALKFRVYHDLRMAEVVDFADPGVGRCRYDYPNDLMLARDERWQQNRLLGEWLALALRTGIPHKEYLDHYSFAQGIDQLVG